MQKPDTCHKITNSGAWYVNKRKTSYIVHRAAAHHGQTEALAGTLVSHKHSDWLCVFLRHRYSVPCPLRVARTARRPTHHQDCHTTFVSATLLADSNCVRIVQYSDDASSRTVSWSLDSRRKIPRKCLLYFTIFYHIHTTSIGRWIMNQKLQPIWKYGVVSYFKILKHAEVLPA